MTGHHRKLCTFCGTLISQCRCPGPRALLRGVCPVCQPLTADERPTVLSDAALDAASLRIDNPSLLRTQLIMVPAGDLLDELVRRGWSADRDSYGNMLREPAACAKVEGIAEALGPQHPRDDKELVCARCGPTDHRYRPSPDAGPYWRCSECGQITPRKLPGVRRGQSPALDEWHMSREDVDLRVDELKARYKEARDAGRLPLTASYLTNGLQHLHDRHPDGCMPWTATWLAEQVLACMDEVLRIREAGDEEQRLEPPREEAAVMDPDPTTSATHRYRIEIDYESPDQYSVGAVKGLKRGDPATGDQIIHVLETVARLYRQDFGGPAAGPCVRYLEEE